MRIVKSLVPALLLATLFSNLSYAASADRIGGTIDSGKLVVLKSNVSPMAQPQFDQGPSEPSRLMRVTALFTPTAQQDAAIKRLLDDLQNEKSPNFHKWLTIEQYADQFGMTPRDIAKVSAWLEGQGFKVTYVAKGRDFLSFEGTAAQMESALKTSIHNFSVDGKMHFANATAPMIPAALSGVVGGFRGLHNFFPHAMLRQHPNYSVPSGGSFFTALAPGDIATIYQINPLYQLATPIDGTGQKVVIAGQSDVFLSDLNLFRTAFGLPTISGCTTSSDLITACNSTYFQMVIPTTGTDPGPVSGDLGESDLDIEWVSSVARKAQVIFVTSGSAGGVDDSASWAIDQQLAPVISYSYGLCEAFVTQTFITSGETEFKKAATLGISFFAASGDNAAATCDQPLRDHPVTLGPSVSYPASSAYVTGVGGTEFNEGSGSFWNSSNGANGVSAKSYIPELAWNDTALSISNGNGIDGTGGGPSNCASGTGTTGVTVGQNQFAFEICNAPPNGGFPKPSWQVGVTPTDSVRDVPDISFSASNANDPFIVCTPEEEVSTSTTSTTSTCNTSINDALTTWNSAFGGTSASTPVAAGMTVLLNQYLGTNGLGNMNPQLYKIHGTTPSAFNDILGGSSSTTTSDNMVPCAAGTPTITGWPSALKCPTSGTLSFGFTAGAGYDLVTGLGSINFNTLFTHWAASRVASTTAIAPSATNVQVPASVTFVATVTPSASTGTVSFSTLNNGVTTALGTAIINLPFPTATTGTATLTVASGSAAGDLPGGTNNVTATFMGDAAHNLSTSAAAVITVTAPDFSILAAPTSTTVTAGHNSTGITLTFTPINGLNQPITPSCTVLPTGATCAFNPPTVTMDGTNPKSTVMTISTAASMAPATPTTPNVTISATGSGVTHTTPFSLTMIATDQSFTLAPQNANYSVTRPQSVNAVLTLTPGTTGFTTAVTYTCADTVSETTCKGPSGATTTTSPAFVITTTAPTRAKATPFGGGKGIFYAALLPGLLGIMFTVGSRKRSPRGMRMLGLIAVLAVSTLGLGSCSGSNSSTHDPGTPTGPQSVTVNATTGGANPVTATTTINFTVN